MKWYAEDFSPNSDSLVIALGSFIEKVNSSYINVGDSDRISKSALYIFEGLSGSFLIYDNIVS